MDKEAQKLKEKSVGQALEYCSHHKMQDVKPEDFEKIIKIIHNFYLNETNKNNL